MLLLSLCIPGKIGKIIRKLFFLFFLVMLLYWILWFIAFKNFNIYVINSTKDSKINSITFKFVNNSFLSASLLDLNLYSANNKLIKKIDDIKLNIAGNESATKTLKFIQVDYKYIEFVYKTMFTKMKFKSKFII